jgi:ribosomal 50S subunit-recycling heat shock protein
MHHQGDGFQFFADRGDSRLRLDQVLARRVTTVAHMSRSVAQRWIEAGVVTVDGRVARRSSDRVRDQAAIHVSLPPDTIPSFGSRAGARRPGDPLRRRRIHRHQQAGGRRRASVV